MIGYDDMTCKDCAYWQAIADAKTGECHCRPPQVVVVRSKVATHWPITKPDDWCSEIIKREDWDR